MAQLGFDGVEEEEEGALGISVEEGAGDGEHMEEEAEAKLVVKKPGPRLT